MGYYEALPDDLGVHMSHVGPSALNLLVLHMFFGNRCIFPSNTGTKGHSVRGMVHVFEHTIFYIVGWTKAYPPYDLYVRLRGIVCDRPKTRLAARPFSIPFSGVLHNEYREVGDAPTRKRKGECIQKLPLWSYDDALLDSFHKVVCGTSRRLM